MSANDILALQTMEELLLVMQDQLAVEVRQRGLCISPSEPLTRFPPCPRATETSGRRISHILADEFPATGE